MRTRVAVVLSRLRQVVEAFDGAVSAARAVEAGRKPSPAALRKLGIDRDAFDGLRLD
jgi:hypothetical protein